MCAQDSVLEPSLDISTRIKLNCVAKQNLCFLQPVLTWLTTINNNYEQLRIETENRRLYSKLKVNKFVFSDSHEDFAALVVCARALSQSAFLNEKLTLQCITLFRSGARKSCQTRSNKIIIIFILNGSSNPGTGSQDRASFFKYPMGGCKATTPSLFSITNSVANN